MRVPYQSAHDQFSRQIQDLNQRQIQLQRELASGQRVRDAADDPVAAGRAFGALSEKSRIQTYARNLDQAGFIGRFTLETLEQFKSVVDTAAGIARSNDGLTTDNDLSARGQHMSQLVEQSMSTLNASHSGAYLFAGANTGETPYHAHRYTEFLEDADGNYVDLAGDPVAPGDPPIPSVLLDATGAVVYDSVPDPSGVGTLSVGRPIPPELVGQISHIEYTGTTDASDDVAFSIGESSRASPYSRGETNAGYADMLNDMIALRDAFFRKDIDDVRSEASRFDESQESVVYGMVELGAKIQGFESVERINSLRFDQLESDVAQTVDAEIAETIVELNRMQTAYEAALSSGSKVLGLSLLDYLR